jgi:hypothetical protein
VPGPEYPPLENDQQIGALAEAVSAWVGRHPRPTQPAFAFAGTEPFSPYDLALALQIRSGEVYERFLHMTRFALEVETFEGLLAGFRGPTALDGPEPR